MCRERYSKVNNNQIHIIEKALARFTQLTRFQAEMNESGPMEKKDREIDGTVVIHVHGQDLHLNSVVKNDLRLYQLDRVYKAAKDHTPFLLVAKRFYPDVKKALQDNEINYIEETGNTFLRNKNVFLLVDGRQLTNEAIERPKTRAFGRAGLKVIFQLLIENQLAQRPYREIANTTGTALGNVKYIMDDLHGQGFLIKGPKGRYQLINKKKLLEKWIPLYDEKLKPTLLIGNFKFAQPELFDDAWKALKLPGAKTWWGGEPAGNILTNYLRPEVFTMYTENKFHDVIRLYHVVPDEKGNIEIYEKFWADHAPDANYMPPLLVYADLMNTGESRCMETAQKIYDDKLAGLF